MRTTALPRFEKNNNKKIYSSIEQVILPIEGAQDGVHLYVLNGGNSLEEEFTASKYNQKLKTFIQT